MSVQNSDIALAIIDFLRSSVSKKEVSEDFGESVDVAIDCIADAYGVDKDSDKDAIKTKFNGQSLVELVNSAAKKSAGENVSVHIPEEDTELKARAEALKLEGNRAIAKRDFNEAVEKYSEALNLIPNHAVYLSNRAAAYSSLRQHDLAAQDAELAIESDPSYAKAYSRLGLAKFALGDAKAAMDAYKGGLDAEGANPSESMKKGYETAKARVQSDLETSLENTTSSDSNASRDTPSSTSSATDANARGFPDMSNLSSMFGGAGGAGGMSDLFNNPQVMQAAQNLMSNPQAMQNLMSNPALKQMASQFGLGGGAGAGASGNSGESTGSNSESGNGTPDLSDLMNNPMLANLANQFMGGRNNNQQ